MKPKFYLIWSFLRMLNFGELTMLMPGIILLHFLGQTIEQIFPA
jgi:hypothetical protein